MKSTKSGNLFLFFLVQGLALQASFAQTDSTLSKLDTLAPGQKKITEMQQKIYAEV